MASTDPPNVPDRIEKAEEVNGAEEGSSSGAAKAEESSAKAEESSSSSPATKPATSSKDVSPTRQDHASGTASTRLTPLNGSTSTTTLSMPHPKKFSHIDINKRFLEKNSAASSTGHAASPTIASKPGSALQKPATPITTTHSRLITAKLTTDIQRSSTTGPGWSRPSSASPSAVATPSTAGVAPKALPTSASTSAAPQLPTVGKVIQPQPREALPLSRKDSAGKSVWGATKPASAVQSVPDTASSEFPTAAEAAQSQHVEKKTPVSTDDKKQPAATDEEADAFRGRHLDPNVHHWDDDDNDDNNFLDEVIEFDDGRQYTVQHTQESEDGSKLDGTNNAPVSKEERFADDFDRSWPRKHSTEPSQQPLRSPSVSSQSLHSPQDSSRVLFNERSNRLEPYSSNRFGPPRDSQYSRRDSRSDMTTSPVEFRNGRDGHVQLLQKSGQHRDSFYEGRRDGFPSHEGSRFRDRGSPRREFPSSNGWDHTRSREHQFERDGGPSDRTRRMSNVSSSHLSPIDSPREGRPLPPHLSGAHPMPSMWRAPSERSRRLSTTSSVSVPPARQPSHSPASTHAPLSPALGDTALTASPAADIDEVRKAAMHSAAERARLRRQQEEEEREKHRERARQKAAEIEAKMKAAEQAKSTLAESDSKKSVESEADSIIEDAIKSVTQSMEQPLSVVPEEPSATATPTEPRPPVVTAPSNQGVQRPPRRLSVDGPSPATEADSWRSKTRPIPTTEHPPASAPSNPAVLCPLAVTHVDHLSLIGDETLEVVDFHEHGKLVGVHADDSRSVEPVSTSASSDSVTRRSQRPVASDFFHDHHDTPTQPTDTTPSFWRRRPSAAQDAPPSLAPIQTTHPSHLENGVGERTPPEHTELQVTTMHPYPHHSSQTRPPDALDVGAPYLDHYSEYAHPLRSPYREAPMAALDDTMARIKGALAGMHHKPEAKRGYATSQDPRVLSDTVHQQQYHHSAHDDHIVREVFDVTGCEIPTPPKPAWGHCLVKIPRRLHDRIPLPPNQNHIMETYTIPKLDIITVLPPNDGLRRGGKTNINDFLFPRPFMPRGRLQYSVKLPRKAAPRDPDSLSQPVVNLPTKPNGIRSTTTGAFGRNRDTDGLPSWRKPPASPLRQQADLLAPPAGGLDTVSRSPPPETPSRTNVESGTPQVVADVPVITVPPSKAKTQPNSSEGPKIAFYRDSPNDLSGRQASPMNFVVRSELEQADTRTSDVPAQGSSAQEASQPSFPTLDLVSVKPSTQELPLVPESLSSSQDPIVEFRKGVPPPVQGPITPPTHSGNLPSLTWAAQREAAQQSPSRPPDPEHLRAVWLSTSNKPEKPTVNSLRGIADDLNVPLNIQNAKMEDIPTPPLHTSTQASRLSIMHDITRTFQQVPTPSAHSASLATVPLPPAPQPSNARASASMTSPVQRQPQLPPSAPAGMRLPYGGYPSPMMSSPSPTLVYAQAMTPSPIPQQMMANSPYAQPMWIPVPPGSGPPGMMRPMGSPYGAQLMPYPPAGAMYAPPPNMQGPGIPTSPSMPGRPPANVMLTPSGTQGQPSPYPMYAASPVMMHAMAAPTQGYPGPAQQRGPPPRGAYDPQQVPAGMQPPSSFAPPQSPAYPNAQPNMYVRQTW